MLKMANIGYTTSADFADYLVKEKKIPFREAYNISSKVVSFAEKNKKNLDQLSLKDLKKFYKDLDKKVLEVFKVKNSMNSKISFGGTAEKNIKKMLRRYRSELK